MAFYKKEPTAFTQGNKGQGPKPKGDEGQNPKPNKAWNKKDNNDEKPEPMCKSCGGKGCSCDEKTVNDWENKA